MSAPSSEEGLNALDNIIAENEKRGDWGALALFSEAFPTSLSTVDDSSVSPMIHQQPFASPEEALEHFGTKGMHWGVRKEQPKSELSGLIKEPITRTTKNGDQFTLSQVPPNWLQKGLTAASPSYRKQFKHSAYLSIKDKSGKKIGAANFWHKGPDTVYLNWITINKHSRGNGYASSVLRAAEDHSRAAGKKKMVLEVPGNSPDARHIYEKMGFKVTKEASEKEAREDQLWGGLTQMEKRLDN